MTIKSLGGIALVITAAAVLAAGCDRSRQSADGSTQAGDTGTATVQTSNTVADTGSPEQGGANGAPSGKGVVNGMSTTSGQQPAPEQSVGLPHPTKGP